MRVTAARIAAISAGFVGLGVAASAVGSHALAGTLDTDGLRRFQTATQILMWQGIGLLALMRWASDADPARYGLIRTGAALLLGTVIFCGSVYALAFGAPRAIASIAPFGGLLMIGGWLVAGGLLWRTRR